MKYYPAFLDIYGKAVVVVGGGAVAERKVRLLIEAGADVRIISPDVTGGIRRLIEKGLVRHLKRRYRKGDLKGAFIVIAATSSSDVNEKIASGSECLVNAVNVPDSGNFIVPSVLRRGPLMIAVSSEGVSPAVSKRIRKELESLYNREFASYLRFVDVIRSRAMEEIPDNARRRQFLKSLASEEMLSTLREQGFPSARKKILSLLQELSRDR